MKTLIVIIVFFVCTALEVQSQTGYIFINGSKLKDSSKIGKSTLNKFIDTADISNHTGCLLQNEYIYQNLKNGKYYQYFRQDTNKVAFELNYENNKLTSFKSYWFNDTLRLTGQYIAGVAEGKWIGYYNNGKVIDIFIWTKGVHHEFYFYFVNGNLKRHSMELEINDGKYRLWETEDYYSNGQMKQKGQTKNGNKINTWIYYNKNGTVKEIKKYKKPCEFLGPADWKD
ncbi:MAG: hypothetical protein V2A54_15820 [Bacteroidota bacterium]